MTLHQLRALLERALHADGPTPPHIARLGSTVTVKDLSRAYLSRRVYYVVPARPATWLVDSAAGYTHHVCIHDPQWPRAEVYPYQLDLTDAGTVHAVKVALALALGLDPGPMGSDCRWHHRCPGAPVWVLEATDSEAAFVRWDPRGVSNDGFDRELHAPTVAAESDPVRALILAVEHVLGAP